jgi:hypothetical protein
MAMTVWSANTSKRCSCSHAPKAGASGRAGLYRRTILVEHWEPSCLATGYGVNSGAHRYERANAGSEERATLQSLDA